MTHYGSDQRNAAADGCGKTVLGCGTIGLLLFILALIGMINHVASLYWR